MATPNKAELQAAVLEKRVAGLERQVGELEKSARAAGDTPKKLTALEIEAKTAREKWSMIHGITEDANRLHVSFKEREIRHEQERKKQEAEAAEYKKQSLKQEQALVKQEAKQAKQQEELLKVLNREMTLESRLANIEVQLKVLMSLAHEAAADAKSALTMATSASRR